MWVQVGKHSQQMCPCVHVAGKFVTKPMSYMAALRLVASQVRSQMKYGPYGYCSLDKAVAYTRGRGYLFAHSPQFLPIIPLFPVSSGTLSGGLLPAEQEGRAGVFCKGGQRAWGSEIQGFVSPFFFSLYKMHLLPEGGGRDPPYLTWGQGSPLPILLLHIACRRCRGGLIMFLRTENVFLWCHFLSAMWGGF